MHRRDSFKQHSALKISSVHINHAIYNRVGIGMIQESNLPPTLQVIEISSLTGLDKDTSLQNWLSVQVDDCMPLPCETEVHNLELTAHLFLCIRFYRFLT